MKTTRILIFLIILAVILLVISLKPQITGLATDPINNTESGLLALWHMNEGSGTTITDSSGNGNTGTIIGATWVDGKFNKALSFNGVSNYINVTTPQNLGITTAGTIEAWINPSSNWSDYAAVIDKTGPGESVDYRIQKYSDTNELEFYDGTNILHGGTITTGSWNQVVVTISSGTCKGYINGAQVFSGTCKNPLTSVAGDKVWIGNEYTGSIFTGMIDEVAVFNRALSASEIQTHYNNGMGGGAGNPTASTTASPTSGTSPLSVSFTCSGSGGTSPYTYSWTFGDSGTSSSQNPSHTYSAGTFTSTCTVTDSASKTGTSSKTITATGADTTNPTVSVSHSPSSPTTTDSVTLTATASDNVGVTGINIYVDGASKKTCTSSPCSTTAQTYSLGNHTYYATASDAAGNSGRDPTSGTKSFTVTNASQPSGVGTKAMSLSGTVAPSTSVCLSISGLTGSISKVWTTVQYTNGVEDNITMSDVGLCAGTAGDGSYSVNALVSRTAGTFYYKTVYVKSTTGAISTNSNILSLTVQGTTPNTNLTWLHTSGKYIKDEYGQKIFMRGTAQADLTWRTDFQMGSDTWDNMMTATNRKVNVVRLALSHQDDLLNPGVFDGPVDTFVNWATQNHVYVIIEFHGGLSDSIDVQIANDPTNFINWHLHWVNKYKNNPTVAGYELYNEPYSPEFDANRNEAAGRLKFYSMEYATVQAIEAANPKALVLVASGIYSWIDQYWVDNSLPGNAVYTWDNYYKSWPSQTKYLYKTGQWSAAYTSSYNWIYDQIGNALEADLPVWESEVGWMGVSAPACTGTCTDSYSCTGNCEPGWQQEMADYLAINNLLETHWYVWWWWWNPDNYGLVNEDGKTLSPQGQVWAQYLGGSTNATPPSPPPSCTESWSCGIWSTCVNNQQTRTCTDSNSCGTTNNKPTTSQSCQSCIESWSCNAWSSCVNNLQTRTCTDSNSCGTINNKPNTSQSCQSCIESWLCSSWSTCNNGLQTRTCTDSNACGTTTLKPQVSQTCCMEDWTCSGWSSCIGGAQTRTCTDNNACGTTGLKPNVTQSCVCTESWTCGAWSSCVNNLQTRTCTDANTCGTTNQKPNISQTCTTPLCIEDWTCETWSDCISNTQTRTCTDNNKCGTTQSKPAGSQSCVMPTPQNQTPNETTPIVSAEQPSVGPSGTMGGTSFGGSMGSGVIKSATLATKALKYQFENLPIYEVGLTTLVDVTGAKVSIEDLGNVKPQTTNLIPDGIIYRYVNLATDNIQKDQTQNITIKFKVLQSFYKDNEIDPRVTRLQRWDGSKWNKLDTIPTGSDTTYYYFSASPQSLSIFAITAEITGLLPPSTTCSEFCDEGEALNVDSCQCVSTKVGVAAIPWEELLNPKNLPYTAVAVVIIGIIILFIFLRRR